MRFNLVVGNPPYQEDDGSGLDGGSALYDKFIRMADKISDLCVMIIPMRWMVQYKMKGIDPNWVESELHNQHYRELRYALDSTEVFTGIRIRGGVMYFLRDLSYVGTCRVGLISGGPVVERELAPIGVNTFVIDNTLESILLKVLPYLKVEHSFRDIVGATNEFGIESNVDTIGRGLRLYKSFGVISECSRAEVRRNWPYIDMYKVIISRAFGTGKYGEMLPDTRIIGPNEVCSGSFIMVGKSFYRGFCENVAKYMKTKFMAALVGVCKSTHNATRDAYRYVPLQNFSSQSDINWSVPISSIDKQLYDKYGLTQDEIDYIESTIRISA